MALEFSIYPIAPKGLATSFTEAELPDDYALIFKNRFINAAGGAEKRQGIVRYGATITSSPTITGIHELMKKDGTTILFVSAAGKIYRYDSATVWTTVYSAGTTSATYRSVQMGAKLIFNNGEDRNIYTEDGITFKELLSVIERGQTTAGSNAGSLHDSNVTNWLTSQVKVRDIVYNATVSGYGVITAVTTASVQHTPIASSAGAYGAGSGSANQTNAQSYVIIDGVELNIIPTLVEDDNVALSITDREGGVNVSAVSDWTKTEARVGDFINNTTKNWLSRVTSITTASLLMSSAPSSAGDSLVFLKSAMPIASRTHVHFGRFYMVDERDGRRIVISGPNNPEDLTSDAGTLESNEISFGSYQPTADKVIAFASYQRFMSICGLRNVFLFEGTIPIVDTSSANADFNIVGLFPQGAVSPDGAISVGNDLVYVSVDGIQAVSLQNSTTTLGRANLSEPLRTTMRDEIADAATSDIYMFHYPRRSWLCVKISDTLYVYNYTPFFGNMQQVQQASAQLPLTGSWSIFDGPFAQQKVFAVLADGSLLCAGTGGKVYKFDQNTYTDDGVRYSTKYQTGWLSMEPKARSPRLKQGHYIQPVLDAGDQITYTVSVEAPFDIQSTESILIDASDTSQAIGNATIGNTTIGGTSIVDAKYSLRWRGKEARFTFETNDSLGPDVLSRFTVYFTKHGAR